MSTYTKQLVIPSAALVCLGLGCFFGIASMQEFLFFLPQALFVSALCFVKSPYRTLSCFLATLWTALLLQIFQGLSTSPSALLISCLFTCSLLLSFHLFKEVERFLSPEGNKSPKRGSLLLDCELLSDIRVVDFLSSGLFNHALFLPAFQIEELQKQPEKAKTSLEHLKNILSQPELEAKIIDSKQKSMGGEKETLLQLAFEIKATLLTKDPDKAHRSVINGVRIANFNTLSSLLKPVSDVGQTMQIKVQRYGKEENQGVGYLDDGTMVVINGGADYLGETIKAVTLSVKHTTAGRIIFCNAAGMNDTAQRYAYSMRDLER